MGVGTTYVQPEGRVWKLLRALCAEHMLWGGVQMPALKGFSHFPVYVSGTRVYGRLHPAGLLDLHLGPLFERLSQPQGGRAAYGASTSQSKRGLCEKAQARGCQRQMRETGYPGGGKHWDRTEASPVAPPLGLVWQAPAAGSDTKIGN